MPGPQGDDPRAPAPRPRRSAIQQRRGGPVPSAAVAAAARQEKADAFAARVLPTIRQLQGQGLGLRAIARELCERGILTASGGRAWTATTVRNVLARGSVSHCT